VNFRQSIVSQSDLMLYWVCFCFPGLEYIWWANEGWRN